MKVFKQIFLLMLALMIAFTFFACDDKKPNANDDSNSENIKTTNATEDDILKAYFDAIEKTDAETYLELIPEKAKTAYKNYEGNNLNSFAEEKFEYYFEKFEAVCGENIKISVNTTAVSEMSDEEFDEIKETYDYWSLNDIEIEKGSLAEFEIAVIGDNGEGTGSGNAMIIKEDGNWVVYDVKLNF